jgi:hypothetical protein
MDRGPRRYLPAISLRGESNNLESRIERVSGMYFFEKLAGRLGKRDKHVSDVLRKERCPGSREREYVQSMRYRGNVSVKPDILHVVVNRMIVSRNGLEGRGVRIGECAAWCAKDFANAKVCWAQRWARFLVFLLSNSCRHRFYRCSSTAGLSLRVTLMPSYFLLRMAATNAASPRIILRRDRQLDPSSESRGASLAQIGR